MTPRNELVLPTDDEILGLDWSRPLGSNPSFLEWFRLRFEPGHHLNVAMPTGGGKTNACSGILQLRKYVLAFDVKGGDDTLAETGWPRISGAVDRLGHWLPRDLRSDLADGRPVRAIIGLPAADFATMELNWQRQEQMLQRIFAQRGWTVYVPDLQLLTEAEVRGILTALKRYWLAARSRKISLVTDMQEFAWTPRLARSQPRWFIAGYTRDLDSVESMARAAGRSNAEMKGMVQALKTRMYAVVVFSNNPRDPVVLTVPDRLSPRRAA